MTSSSAAPAPVHLVCSAAEGVPEAQRRAACAALADALGRRAPARPIRLQAAPPGGGLEVRLRVTTALTRKIGAELHWRDGGRRGASTEISVRAVDTGLGAATYRALADRLVDASGLEL